MLTHPTSDRLIALGLTGMAKALEEQRRQQCSLEGLSFEERLALLVDREAVERESKRLVARLRFAGLRQSAVIEDLDTRAARGLDKVLLPSLPPANGSNVARTCSSQARPAPARVGSPVRSVTRPVAMIDPFFTTAYHDCSMRSP
jgi:IstB-like ATP binding protein